MIDSFTDAVNLILERLDQMIVVLEKIATALETQEAK